MFWGGREKGEGRKEVLKRAFLGPGGLWGAIFGLFWPFWGGEKWCAGREGKRLPQQVPPGTVSVLCALLTSCTHAVRQDCEHCREGGPHMLAEKACPAFG